MEDSGAQKCVRSARKTEIWLVVAFVLAVYLANRHVEYAASFFLLADHLRDAVQVCLNQLNDAQLAIAITRVYEGDDGPVLREILEERVLPEAAAGGNRWMASWAFWMLKRRDAAVRSLVVGIPRPAQCYIFSWKKLTYSIVPH